MIALLAALSAHAVVETVEVCVQFKIDFVDVQWGDFWTANTNRIARGIDVEITDQITTQELRLNQNTGCVTATVDVPAKGKPFTFRVLSTARVSGVDLASHDSDDWSSQPISWVEWVLSANHVSQTKELPPTQVWQALAVGTWVFHRNGWHMDQGNTRGCCLRTASTYQGDGTCPPTPLINSMHRYQVIDDAVRFFVGETGHCGASSFGDQPAVRVRCPKKWVIAHELGHVVAGMRMGGRDKKDETAPLDGCMADYRDVALTEPIDDGTNRGDFTKEYMSTAFREGWATFFSIWAWNARTESDCEHPNDFIYRDFDLDGVADALPSGGFDCIGTPYLGPDPPSPPMDHQDWLGDMQIAPAVSCQSAAPEREGNRSSVYDVARMLWALTERDDDPIPPAALADVYIDMCPRVWATSDSCVDDDPDEFPLMRWLSATGDHYPTFGYQEGLAVASQHIFHVPFPGFPQCE